MESFQKLRRLFISDHGELKKGWMGIFRGGYLYFMFNEVGIGSFGIISATFKYFCFGSWLEGHREYSKEVIFNRNLPYNHRGIIIMT